MQDTLSKGDLTRAAIIDAAHELFITRGYNATSMRRIAQEAGIALGGIYNHFDGKEEIFKAVFIENHPILEMLPVLEQAQGNTVEEFIRDTTRIFMEAIDHRPKFLSLLFIEMVEFDNRHSQEIAGLALPRGIEIINKFQQAEGRLRDIPPAMIIRTFIGLFLSYMLAEMIFKQIPVPEFTENALQYYVDVYLYGILEREQV